MLQRPSLQLRALVIVTEAGVVAVQSSELVTLYTTISPLSEMMLRSDFTPHPARNEVKCSML